MFDGKLTKEAAQYYAKVRLSISNPFSSVTSRTFGWGSILDLTQFTLSGILWTIQSDWCYFSFTNESCIIHSLIEFRKLLPISKKKPTTINIYPKNDTSHKTCTNRIHLLNHWNRVQLLNYHGIMILLYIHILHVHFCLQGIHNILLPIILFLDQMTSPLLNVGEVITSASTISSFRL